MRAATSVESDARARLAWTALLLRSASSQALARARGLVRGTAAIGGSSSSFDEALEARLPASGRSADGPAAPPRDATAPALPTPDGDTEASAVSTGGERYVVQPGDTLWKLSVSRFHTGVEALARANGITDPRRLRAGQVLVVRRDADLGPHRVVASWYGPGFDAKPMANGDPYDRHAATIAHKTLPLGTEVELTNPRTGVTVRARVTDRGPYVEGRDVDLSYGLAERLDMVRAGVGELLLRVRG